MTEDILERGFAFVPAVLDAKSITFLSSRLEAAESRQGARRRGGAMYAIRRLCARVPEIAELADSDDLKSLVRPVLGDGARLVRSIFFDKPAGAKWSVPWHQDMTIAVRERIDLPGFGPWTVKEGTPHVQPPRPILDSMLTVRLHLDDADEDNGALRVLPGTHRDGPLDASAVDDAVRRGKAVVGKVRPGDAFVMRPLLLHSSASGTSQRRRRVVHLEYCSAALPGRLEWAE